jgi:cation-transporting ATPase F
MLIVAVLLVGGAWWLFEWERSSGKTLPEAQTAALNLFVVVEAFYLFNCRSLTHSVRYVGLLSNRWVIGGVTVQAIGQVALTYLPFMNRAFGTAPITAVAWLQILVVALLATAVVGAEKRLRRRPEPELSG